MTTADNVPTATHVRADRDYRWAVVRGVRGFGNGSDCRIAEIVPRCISGPAVMAAVRDVFGDPFAPVAFHESWRTPTAVGLARAMYDGRDFGAMPILADSLEEAGCDLPSMLGHCRDLQQVHVRGCWVADLVLNLR